MKKMEYIKNEWTRVFTEMSKTPGFARMASGDMTVAHYKEIMRQIFHHARENPQIQALATVYFRGRQRDMVKTFYRHAISEIGHDQLAMNDLAMLGEDVSCLPYERPLPATSALLSYAFYQIQYHNPIGYLGYLFHLEFMPTQNGRAYMDMFSKIGVPVEAMSFIRDHASVDVGHNKLMEQYVEHLITTPDDLESVVYAATVTAKLYANMIQESFEHADHPRTYGIARREWNALGADELEETMGSEGREGSERSDFKDSVAHV